MSEDNIVSFKPKVHSDIQQVINFLAPYGGKQATEVTRAILEIPACTPVVNTVNLPHYLGFVSGYVSGAIQRVIDDLSMVEQNKLNASSIGAAVMAENIVAINSDGPLVPISIPFKDTTFSFNFLRDSRQAAPPLLVSFHENGTSIYDDAFNEWLEQMDMSIETFFGHELY